MRTSRSSRSGFSIVEVMVIASVSLVILALLADVFIQALHRTEDGRLRVDMQQRAVFAINVWERDIEKTSARAMVVREGDPYCVALTKAERVSGDKGTVTWMPEIICWAYKKGERVWQRETYPPKEPSFGKELSQLAPYLPTSGELEALAKTDGGTEKIMCDNVEEFSLTDKNGNTGVLKMQPLLFRLKLRRPLSTSERLADFTVERRYTLRNSF